MENTAEEYKDNTQASSSASAGGVKAKTGRKGPSIFLISAIILINAAVSVLSVYVYDKYYAQKIAAVDLQGYVQKVQKYVVNGRFNEEQYKQSVDKMEEAIMSVPKNRALITRDVALRNIETVNIPNPLFSQADDNATSAAAGGKIDPKD